MPAKATEERLAEIAACYLLEQSVSRAARKSKCSKRQVRKAVKAAGLTLLSQSEAQSGAHNPSWTGGETMVGEYKYLHRPDHPNATKAGYVAEHRLKIEEVLGRLLLREEVVHHKDGNPRNNALENLQLFGSNAEHLAAELKGRCPNWTEDGLRRIREGVEKMKRRRSSRPPQESDAPPSR